MKNIVMLSAILAVVSVPAAAVQKCVALGRGTTACTDPGGLSRPPTGKADWSLTCTTRGTSVTVNGIGVCAGQVGNTSTPLDSLTISTCFSTGQCPAEEAVNCWCRMLSPALSQWVYSGLSYRLESECVNQCASTCYQYLIDKQALRNTLFGTSTLSD